jgi:hypothetical protein
MALATMSYPVHGRIGRSDPLTAQRKAETRAAIAFTLLTAAPATLKGGADLTKTDVSSEGIAYGDGARGQFATAMGAAVRTISGGSVRAVLASWRAGSTPPCSRACVRWRAHEDLDAFIDSLRAGNADERSPLFSAARYLDHAARRG